MPGKTTESCGRVGAIQPKRRGSDRFTCEFRGDFKGIGISLDVDEEGRLVVQEVNEGGEAAGFADLLQGESLHIVDVGLASKEKERAADELLRKLMTLPRPVRVEFARTTVSPEAAVVDMPPGTRTSSTARQPLATGAGRVADDEDASTKRPVPAAVSTATCWAPEDVAMVGEAPKPHQSMSQVDSNYSMAPKGHYDHSTSRFSCQSGSGQANKSDHKVSRNTGDGRGGDDDDGWQAGGKKPPPPPQRRGTVAAGIGWEESLRSSAVGVSQRENSDDRKVNARKGSGSGGLKEDVAGKGAGKELQPRGQVEQTHWSSGSSIRSRMQSDGQESMHRWLQDDSDDSDRDEMKTSPRHSWYTVNRKRGGHASDRKPSSPLARAAAVARARQVNATVPHGGVSVGEGPTAGPGHAHDGSGDKLPNAVSARYHRSPSYHKKNATGSKGSISNQQLHIGVGGVAEAEQENKGGLRNDDDNLQHGAERCVDTSEYEPRSANPGAATHSVPEARDKTQQGSKQSLTAPRKGSVSVRHHRSPSQNLQGGPTLGVDGSASAATETAAVVVNTSPSKSATGGKETAPDGTLTMASMRLAAAMTASELPLVASSTSESAAVECSVSSDGNLDKWDPKQRGKNSGSLARGPSSSSNSKNGQDNIKAADVGADAAGDSAVQQTTSDDVGTQRHPNTRRWFVHPTCDSESNSSKDCSNQQGVYTPEEGDIASLIQNHTPFKRRTEAENGRGLTTAALEGSDHSLPDPPIPAATGSAPPALGQRRPSMGPANPRAMYGHMPPPVRPGQQSLNRRPSSVVLSPSSLQEECAPKRSTVSSTESKASRSRQAATGPAGRAGADGGGGGNEKAKASRGMKERHASVHDVNEKVSTRVSSRAKDGLKKEASGEAADSPPCKPIKFRFKVEKIQLKRADEAAGGKAEPQPGIAVGQAAGLEGVKGTKMEESYTGSGASAVENQPCRITATPLEPAEASSYEAGDAEDMPESQSTVPWEQQLRTMAGIADDRGTSAARRQKADAKKPVSGTGGREVERGRKTQLDDSPTASQNEKVAPTGSLVPTKASLSVPAPATPPPNAWNHLQIDVGCTPKWNAHQTAAKAKPWREIASARRGGISCGEGRTVMAAVVGGARRSGARRLQGSPDGNGRGISSRVRSNSHAPTAAPRGVAAVAAAAAAATAAAEASVTAPSGGSGVGNTSSTRAAIGAAEALERFSASGGGGGGGGSGSNEGGQLGRKHGVARVRVRVRSSVYLIVVRLENNGSILLEDVIEAEKRRHNKRAATVTRLINESTGDDVDPDVPAERSVSSGDCLTAIVAHVKPDGRHDEGITSTTVEVGSGAGSCRKVEGSTSVRTRPAGSAQGHGKGLKEILSPLRIRGSPRGNGDRSPSRRSPTPRSPTQRSPSQRSSTQRSRNQRSPSQRSPSRKSPTRRSPTRSATANDIIQLRDDFARDIFRERRAAGEGVGAFSPPSRPHGSRSISPVTGGGSGASPEHLRASSPRSASPRGARKGPGKSAGWGGGGTPRSRPVSPATSARSAASGYTHYSGFSMRSHGRAAGSEAAFLAQSTLTPEELDGILKEELLKSRKWSARERDAQEKVRRVWEKRSFDFARLQRKYQEAEADRMEKARQRKQKEAEEKAVRQRQRTARAEMARQQARSSRGGRESRAKEAEATHRRRMQQITERQDREHRQHATKVQMMDRRREDVRDSFLDMVEAENESAIQALETPLEMLNRALEEGDQGLEKKARRAILRQQARERVHVRERAARVLAEQRKLENSAMASTRTRQEMESSMMPGPGQYNLRDFSESGGGTYSRSLA